MSCPDCKRGTILEGEPTGIISNIDGAYFAAAPGEPTTKRAILFLTDAFGLPLVNNKLLADMIAKRVGCDVWVPDLFDGVPIIGIDQIELPTRAGIKQTLWSRIRFIISLLPSIRAFYRSRPTVAMQRLENFIMKLQAQKNYEKLGTVGYCFGGTIAAMLAATDHIQSAVVVHPGKLSPEQINRIKVKISWVCAEEDHGFDAPQREQAEALLAGRKGKDNFVEYEFETYKGTVHGFGARPDLSYPEIKEAHEKANDQIVNWFMKTLPA